MRFAYRLGWLLFGIAGFFAPDWTSERFADSMLNAWPEPAEWLPRQLREDIADAERKRAEPNA